jgi:hypothetical protein
MPKHREWYIHNNIFEKMTIILFQKFNALKSMRQKTEMI